MLIHVPMCNGGAGYVFPLLTAIGLMRSREMLLVPVLCAGADMTYRISTSDFHWFIWMPLWKLASISSVLLLVFFPVFFVKNYVLNHNQNR